MLFLSDAVFDPGSAAKVKILLLSECAHYFRLTDSQFFLPRRENKHLGRAGIEPSPLALQTTSLTARTWLHGQLNIFYYNVGGYPSF